jgi:hypothetical protein
MADFNNESSVSSSGSVHNLSVGSDTAPHDLNERVDDIDDRLTVVETLLARQSQLASNSFASNGRSLHMSDLLGSTQNSIMSGNQHSVTLPIGNNVYPLENSNISRSGSASTVVPGGKRRKTKKQKKTKKRGNKGKKLTKRNRK